MKGQNADQTHCRSPLDSTAAKAQSVDCSCCTSERRSSLVIPATGKNKQVRPRLFVKSRYKWDSSFNFHVTLQLSENWLLMESCGPSASIMEIHVTVCLARICNCYNCLSKTGDLVQKLEAPSLLYLAVCPSMPVCHRVRQPQRPSLKRITVVAPSVALHGIHHFLGRPKSQHHHPGTKAQRPCL